MPLPSIRQPPIKQPLEKRCSNKCIGRHAVMCTRFPRATTSRFFVGRRVEYLRDGRKQQEKTVNSSSCMQIVTQSIHKMSGVCIFLHGVSSGIGGAYNTETRTDPQSFLRAPAPYQRTSGSRLVRMPSQDLRLGLGVVAPEGGAGPRYACRLPAPRGSFEGELP